jgi:hypothetical protein
MMDGVSRVDSDSRCVMRTRLFPLEARSLTSSAPLSLEVSFKSPSWRVQQPGRAIHGTSKRFI